MNTHALRELGKPTHKQEQYADKARESLLGSPPIESGMAALGIVNTTDILDGSVATLSIQDIECFNHNPRTKPNPRYAEIKASIAANLIQNQLSVTRRPGHNKYTVYGGGNTRLQIAQELFEAGDQRFATLTVVVRQWRGESNVVAAHLVENELRGDISFWEKAQGIADVRKFIANESGKTLSPQDLNSELRQRHGLNYGLRTVSNMLYAIEYLEPVGAWLQFRMVNLLIRPALTSLFDVAEKLDQLADARSAVSEVLHKHAAKISSSDQIRNTDDHHHLDDDAADPEHSPLDAEKLVSDANSAVAAVLGLDPRNLTAMRKALAQNPRMAVETLRLVTAEMPEHASTTAKNVATANDKASDKQTKAKTNSAVDEGGTSNQSTSSDGFEHPASTNPSPARTEPAATPVIPGGETQVQANSAPSIDAIVESLSELQKLVEIGDFVNATTKQLGFGIYVDFPPEGFNRVNGISISAHSAALRCAVWRLLVSVTGQLDRRFTEQIDHDIEGKEVLWRVAFDRGESAFHQTAEMLLGAPMDSAGQEELHILFTAPEIRRAVVSVLSNIDGFRSTQDELEGFIPLFTR